MGFVLCDFGSFLRSGSFFSPENQSSGQTYRTKSPARLPFFSEKPRSPRPNSIAVAIIPIRCSGRHPLVCHLIWILTGVGFWRESSRTLSHPVAIRPPTLHLLGLADRRLGSGTDGETRTHTPLSGQRILSPVRLPFRHIGMGLRPSGSNLKSASAPGNKKVHGFFQRIITGALLSKRVESSSMSSGAIPMPEPGFCPPSV